MLNRSASDRDRREADRGLPHTDRDELGVLPAHAARLVDLEIGPDAFDPLHRLEGVADQDRAPHRLRLLAVLDHVAELHREVEVAARRVHRAAAEILAIEAL